MKEHTLEEFYNFVNRKHDELMWERDNKNLKAANPGWLNLSISIASYAFIGDLIEEFECGMHD